MDNKIKSQTDDNYVLKTVLPSNAQYTSNCVINPGLQTCSYVVNEGGNDINNYNMNNPYFYYHYYLSNGTTTWYDPIHDRGWVQCKSTVYDVLDNRLDALSKTDIETYYRWPSVTLYRTIVSAIQVGNGKTYIVDSQNRREYKTGKRLKYTDETMIYLFGFPECQQPKSLRGARTSQEGLLGGSCSNKFTYGDLKHALEMNR